MIDLGGNCGGGTYGRGIGCAGGSTRLTAGGIVRIGTERSTKEDGVEGGVVGVDVGAGCSAFVYIALISTPISFLRGTSIGRKTLSSIS